MADGEQNYGGHRQASPMDLLSSMKVVGEAARLVSGRETDKLDKEKVAGAAEDVLEAAKKYGKLEEKGMGQYVQKAETYLHGYHTGSEKPAGGDNPDGSQAKEGGGSGYGDYLKMAEGFLNKSGEGDKPQEGKESGYGGYLKLAQGFLK